MVARQIGNSLPTVATESNVFKLTKQQFPELSSTTSIPFALQQMRAADNTWPSQQTCTLLTHQFSEHNTHTYTHSRTLFTSSRLVPLAPQVGESGGSPIWQPSPK